MDDNRVPTDAGIVADVIPEQGDLFRMRVMVADEGCAQVEIVGPPRAYEQDAQRDEAACRCACALALASLRMTLGRL